MSRAAITPLSSPHLANIPPTPESQFIASYLTRLEDDHDDAGDAEDHDEDVVDDDSHHMLRHDTAYQTCEAKRSKQATRTRQEKIKEARRREEKRREKKRPK